MILFGLREKKKDYLKSLVIFLVTMTANFIKIILAIKKIMILFGINKKKE